MWKYIHEVGSLKTSPVNPQVNSYIHVIVFLFSHNIKSCYSVNYCYSYLLFDCSWWVRLVKFVISTIYTRSFRLTRNETSICLSKYVSISKGLVDFCKFDNFRRFFRNNSTKNCRSEISKDGKDVS